MKFTKQDFFFLNGNPIWKILFLLISYNLDL